MNKNTNTWKKALSGICALTMVFGIAASPAYAMEDMTEPNMSITNHPNSMIPTNWSRRWAIKRSTKCRTAR